MDNAPDVSARVRAASVLAVLSAFAAGCASAMALADFAGRYELRTVDGRSVPDDRLGGAISGQLELRADGRAYRVVRYATSGVPGPIVSQQSGRFEVRRAELTLTIDAGVRREEGAVPLRVEGRIADGTVSLLYPGRGGSPVQEVYVRVR